MTFRKLLASLFLSGALVGSLSATDLQSTFSGSFTGSGGAQSVSTRGNSASALLFQFTASFTNTVYQIRAGGVDNTGGNPSDFRAFLFSDSGGNPGSVIGGSSRVFTSAQSGTWDSSGAGNFTEIILNNSTGVSLSSGTTYYVAFVNNNTSNTFDIDQNTDYSTSQTSGFSTSTVWSGTYDGSTIASVGSSATNFVPAVVLATPEPRTYTLAAGIVALAAVACRRKRKV